MGKRPTRNSRQFLQEEATLLRVNAGMTCWDFPSGDKISTKKTDKENGANVVPELG